MSNVINLPTYEQVAEVLNEIINIDLSAIGTPTSPASNVLSGNAHAKLNWLLSILATVNTNTATANLGTPGTAASNATSAVAHAKLNWLLTNLNTVLTTINSMKTTMLTKPVLKVTGSEANNSSSQLKDGLGMIRPYNFGSSANLYVNVTGSGRLLYAMYNVNGSNMFFDIDGKQFSLNKEGILDIPFSTSLKISYGGSYPPVLIYYELNL